jgi:DNA (cytosine-5)-methyltransferase 1
VNVIDLFAGPGGWDLAARALGLDPLGVEWDDAACATRRAAGLRTHQADVATVNPRKLMVHYGWLPTALDGLIASPPCQSFSMAGKRGGEQDTEHVVACAHELAAGNDTRAEHRAKCEDERSMLVVEPVRWVRDLRPRWVALEQVPPVLELWSLFAHLFGSWGYRTWTGILSAERYGVPQTRKRAILLASLDGQPHPPEPTHQAYVPGEPARHEVTMFGEVLPWVSMAEALGWGMTERPGMTFAPGTDNGGAAYEGGSGARKRLREERDRGAWVVQTNNFTAQQRDLDGKRSKAGSVPYERPVGDPAPTLDGSANGWKLRAGTNAHDVSRPADTPAFSRSLNRSVDGGSLTQDTAFALKGDDWPERRPATTAADDRTWVYNQRQTGAAGRPVTEPALFILAEGLAKGVPVWDDEPDPPKAGPNAVRVTVREAAILQSFPPDHPWKGSRSAQFQQIGNAVPPLLAIATLGAVLGIDWRPVARRYTDDTYGMKKAA